MVNIPIISDLFSKSKNTVQEVDVIPLIYNKSKNVAEKEGKALIAKKDEFLIGDVDDKEQNIRLIDMYFNAYHNFPIVAAAIDSAVEQVVQDFRIDGPQGSDLMKWADAINLKHHLRRICKNGLIAGTYWAEKVKLNNGMKVGLGRLKKPVDFKHLDPRNMRIERTLKGKLIAHVQKVNNKELYWGDKPPKATFAKKGGVVEDMFCFKWNVIASNKYGTSIIKSSVQSLDIKDQIESDLKVVAKRYLAPIIHGKVGDELHPADTTQLSNVQDQLEDIWSDTEYVTNHLVEMSVLGLDGKGVDFKPILDHFDSQIIVGLQTNAALLASRVGVVEGGDKGFEIGMRANGRHIKAIQDELKIAIEDQVFQPMAGNKKNKLIWEAVEERQFETDVEILRGLVTDGLLTHKKANSLLPDQFHDSDVENVDPNPMGFGAQQLGPNKIKDNPNDPTKSTNLRKGSRVNKSDVKVPMDAKGAKKKPQKMENRRF